MKKMLQIMIFYCFWAFCVFSILVQSVQGFFLLLHPRQKKVSSHPSSSSRLILSLATDDYKKKENDEQVIFPSPECWHWSQSSNNTDSNSGTNDDGEWRKSVVDDPTYSDNNPILLRTLNWCKDFVHELRLCPWAIKSLETENAMQVFITGYKRGDWGKREADMCLQVAQLFSKFVHNNPHVEPAAIFFLVFDDPQQLKQGRDETTTDDDDDDFVEFYDWFADLEEYDWELDDVIPAPFHPDWKFGSDDDQEDLISNAASSLAFEKKTPYPTVSFVSSRIVEQAGAAVTEQIADYNTRVLENKTPEQLQELWEGNVMNIKKN